MKDRREVPMKGEMALILPDNAYHASEFDHMLYTVVKVLSDPDDTNPPLSMVHESGLWHPTRALLRIPPDEESRRLFTETKTPVLA